MHPSTLILSPQGERRRGVKLSSQGEEEIVCRDAPDAEALAINFHARSSFEYPVFTSAGVIDYRNTKLYELLKKQ